ncbi:MAG: 54S ribosomal protein L4 mitochondrial [Cirrosporium novae-zelandiae]|nr:MAG: 54S ribosomal protein L4 mitochondrial [Cirrosporium novae-zelandiae]
MAHPSCTRALWDIQLRPFSSLPAYLVPALAKSYTSISSRRCPFSTSSRTAFPRDRNPNRGVSALHRTGTRYPLSVSKDPLPQPANIEARPLPETDPNHGLWGFFNEDKKALASPENLYSHGRAWAVEELRHKSWEDLHCLWWKCVLERNRIATQNHERDRCKAGYGDYEADRRDETVRHTQRAIKQTLTERWYAWQQAKIEARSDDDLDYVPGDIPTDESSQDVDMSEEPVKDDSPNKKDAVI